MRTTEKSSLAHYTDEQLIAEVIERGLYMAVSTRILAELAWSVKNNDPSMTRAIVVRLARDYLGKVL